MNTIHSNRSGLLYAVYNLLNPIPFGFFVAGLLFDKFYTSTAEIFWAKAASWVITFGLLFAIIPRFINLFYVWFRPLIETRKIDLINFWIYGFAIITATLNAFIHGRDAFAIAPTNLILSIITVSLISITYLYQVLASKKVVVGGL